MPVLDAEPSRIDLYNFSLSEVCNDWGLPSKDVRRLQTAHKHFKFLSFPENAIPEDKIVWDAECLRLQAVLLELFAGPLQSVFAATESLLHVDALRQIPSSDSGFLSKGETKDYWKLFVGRNGEGLASYVNGWLGGDPFQVNYNIELIQNKIVSNASEFAQVLGDKINGKQKKSDLVQLKELYENLPAGDCSIKLRDTNTKILLDFADVGVGVSQLIPVIVAACNEEYGLVTMEQPELHVHPAIQVAIGDLFIHGAKLLGDLERVFLIETHSEHLLLRILRRIRETCDDELPNGHPKVTSEDLAVIYVENDKNHTKYVKLGVDNSGEFIDRWPKGFFEERYEELF